MNASQPSRTPLKLVKSRRSRRARRRSLRASKASFQGTSQRAQRSLALETAFKLAINLAISGVALSALMQLVPYHLNGRDQLEELETEVQRTEERVSRLRENFSLYFDPQQTKSIMEQESNLTDPTQLRVVFVKPHRH